MHQEVPHEVQHEVHHGVQHEEHHAEHQEVHHEKHHKEHLRVSVPGGPPRGSRAPWLHLQDAAGQHRERRAGVRLPPRLAALT